MTAFIVFLLALAVVALFAQCKKATGAVEVLTKRVAALEKKVEDSQAAAVPEKVVIPPSPLLATAPLDAPLQVPDLQKHVAPSQSRPPPLPPPLPKPAPAAAPKPATPFNWEAFMGVKLFAWLGGFALFLGVVFMVKYSFENNLITPLGRIVIGGAVGLALVGAGWWLANSRYRATAQSLCATGIVILYADIFAAHSFYGLISLTTAFFAMSAVTLASFILAANLSAQVIVILGLLGGFLTPALLPSGSDNARVLFLYIALLDLGVAAVALRTGWPYLVLLAAIGTTLIQFGWAFQFFNASKGGRAFWIFLGFETLFLAFYFWERFARRSADINPAANLRSEIPASASHNEAATMAPNPWTASAAALAGCAALGFCFWLLAVPTLARQWTFFFSFVFLADAGVLALPVFGRANRGIAFGAGALAFALVAAWIGLFAVHAPLSAALGAIVVFALLHAATVPASAWRPGMLPLTAAGTVTPFLLLIILIEAVELQNPTPVFGVALILTGILLVAAIVRRADWLALSALVGAGLVEVSWQATHFTKDQAIPALGYYGLFLIFFVAFPFCSAQKEKTWSWAISALAQALQFWLFYRAIDLAFPNEWMGSLPAGFVIPAAIGVVALLKMYRADPATGDARLAWQGGALLLFVSLIFPLQFHREWITLGWALEGCALLWLFHRLPHRGLRLVGVALLCLAFVRLALNPAVFEYHKRAATRIWNWYLYAYGITTACLLGGARLFGKPRGNSIDRFGPPLLGSLGAILAFLLLNIEIADYFSVGPTLTFSFTGNFSRDMTYSIAWGLFALGLIVVGMRIRQRAARYAGVALVGVTLGKLFLHDLNDLDELYRIGAFVGVAVILIAASFIYQRFLSPERVRETT